MARKYQTKKARAIAAVAPRPDAKREITMAPEFVSIYANDIQIQISPWDVRLVFGEMGDIVPSDAPVIKIRKIGELRISLPLAKKLTMLMVDQLKSYEAQVGEIPLPRD